MGELALACAAARTGTGRGRLSAAARRQRRGGYLDGDVNANRDRRPRPGSSARPQRRGAAEWLAVPGRAAASATEAGGSDVDTTGLASWALALEGGWPRP